MAYRESPLRRHPIVRFGESSSGSAYSAPIRNLLWWRVTSGLYYDLLDVPDFQNLIGAQFEKYVAGLLRGTTGWVVRPKEMYRPSGFGDTETPDCVAQNDDGEVCAVFECKAIKSTLAAQIKLVSQAGIDRAISDIAKGLVQVAKYRAFLLQTERVAPDCVYAVVTLDDWFFFGEELRKRIFAKAVERSESQGVDAGPIKARSIVLCSCSNLEYLLAHFSGAEVTKTFVAATTEQYQGYELRGIPSSLSLEPKSRHRYVEEEFERLVDFSSDRRTESGPRAFSLFTPGEHP